MSAPDRKTTCLVPVWDDGIYRVRCSVGTNGRCAKHGPHEPHPDDGKACDPMSDGYCRTHGVYVDPYRNQLPTAQNGLPTDNLRQFLAERDVILCRTCMRPLTWETRTEPGFKPRQGWYDDARIDPLICFKAADYRHVPLTDREWAYYEAGRNSVIPPEVTEP